MGLHPTEPEPSYLPKQHGNARTEVRLQGGGSLFVLEPLRAVQAQLDAVWAVVRLEDETEAHVRSSAVTALIDRDSHEGPKPTPLFPQEAA